MWTRMATLSALGPLPVPNRAGFVGPMPFEVASISAPDATSVASKPMAPENPEVRTVRRFVPSWTKSASFAGSGGSAPVARGLARRRSVGIR